MLARLFFLIVSLFSLGSLWPLCPTLAEAEEAEPELIHLYQYKPMYALAGNPYEKIEVSFKAGLIRSVPFYFGYTQLMFWDLFTASPYFYDIDYNPEGFYRLFVQKDQDKWLDFGLYEHESNGRGGAQERSWDRSYLRYHTRTDLGAKSKLYWDFKLWVVFYTNPQNTDLPEYRGAWELNLTLSDFLGPFFEQGDLSLRLYPGGASTLNPFLGGQELTFRSKSAPRAFLPLFVAQVFHGYGESLLDYNVDHWGFRAGIGF